MFINTAKASSLNFDMEDIYDAVREGTWTQDLLLSYAAAAAADVNGDGVMTVQDEWGMSCFDENILAASLVTAGGADSVAKDANDALTLLWNDEAYLNLMENAYYIFHDNSVFTGGERHTSTIFREGRSLFLHGFFLAVDSLEEMEDDYSVLPIPKYEESQPDYLCANYDLMTYVMPKFVSDTEKFGAVLEWLSYEGEKEVKSAYIETTMKYKKARDPAMTEMVQICLDASMVDLGSMYCYDFCSYDAIYGNVMMKNSFTFASFIASREKPITRRLEILTRAVSGEE